MTTRSLLKPHSSAPQSGFALLEKGFRPFFLLGAVFATLGVPLWLIALRGGIEPGGAFGSMQWHAHEMLFGFTSAIIAGFLLTAAGNWSGRETATGVQLAALAGLWTLGRFGVFFAARAPHLAAVADVAFLPTLALTCAVPLITARSRRNYAFIGLLFVLALLNAMSHRAALHGDIAGVRAIHVVALDVILLVIVLITGRVVPMFTRNATGVASIASEPRLERASLASVAALVLSDALPGSAVRSSVLAALGGGLLLLRMRRWGSWHARDGLLWVLHLGTLWVPIGLLLRAGAALTPAIPAGSALHALTAGAIGSLTLGMMARVSLGHTGRMLHASRLTNVAFAGVALAGALRVLAPCLPGALYFAVVDSAGVAWSGSFGLFVLSHAGMLTAPRVDGRPG
jgi:uncharacterized protein involved in response to NO